LELPDDEAAWREALLAHDLWNDPASRRYWGHLTIHVSDEKHQHVVSLSLDTLADTKICLICNPRKLSAVAGTSKCRFNSLH
jgi:hypothetical protein